MVKIINCMVFSVVLMMAGCQNKFSTSAELDDSQREYILSKVNNYHGLIKLYRNKLNRKEDSNTRYKLAKYYYLVEDYESSRHYLQPLLSSRPDEATWLLEGKNLLELGKSTEALAAVTRTLQLNPDSRDAYNIQGILLAQGGNFGAAHQAFNDARRRFVDDDIIINNLAMLAIMQEDYVAARDYLVPLYSRGNSSKKIFHNLVFVLVKLRDFNGAENILRQDKVFNSRDGLLESLSRVKPRSQQQLQQKSALSDVVKSADKSAWSQSQTTTAKQPETSLRQAPRTIQTPKVTPVPTLRIDRTIDKSTQKVMESASLAVTGNLKEVSSIRAGQHQKYFRMTLESRQAINFRELSSAEKNKRIFELLNVKMGENMLQASEIISRNHYNIRKLAFYQKNTDTILIEFEFKHPVGKTNIFRLPADKTTSERLVFDVYLDDINERQLSERQ